MLDKGASIFITGISGQLGIALKEVLKGYNIRGCGIEDSDISKPLETIDLISDFHPDLVIHAAAYTDVDGCEMNPDLAYKVNAYGTRNVALACQKCEVPMVYISTDYIFDGRKRSPYIEYDEPNPLSVYGRSKLVGERIVSSLLNRYYIVRTSWLFGKGRNFVRTILRLASERDELSVVNDQIGCPTYALDLAKTISEIIKTDLWGVYHASNNDRASWFEFACAILEYAGIEKETFAGNKTQGKKVSFQGVKVIPITTEELGLPAPRPSFSVTRNYCLQMQGMDNMRSWREALKDYLEGELKPRDA